MPKAFITFGIHVISFYIGQVVFKCIFYLTVGKTESVTFVLICTSLEEKSIIYVCLCVCVYVYDNSENIFVCVWGGGIFQIVILFC